MVKQVVSGVGPNSSRSDRNLVERTQKIQREAKIQNASGGSYSQRKTNTELAQGQNTAQTASAVSAQPATPPVKVTSAFAPGNPNTPFGDGLDGNTSGRGPEALLGSFNSPDPGAVLIRAIHLYAPTPYTRRMVEDLDAQGMF
jgi:hypothetical protein